MNAARDIIQLTESYFGLKFKKEKNKKLNVSKARHISRYFVFKYCKKLTQTDIAELFGRTRASVINSVNVIQGCLDLNDSDICYHVNEIDCLILDNLSSIGEILSTKKGKTLFASINRELHGLEDNRLDDILRLIKKYKEAYEDVSAIISTPLLQLEDE
jgi:hypothetical protein